MYIVNACYHIVYDVVFSGSTGTYSLEAGVYGGSDLFIHVFYLWLEAYSRRGGGLDRNFAIGKWTRWIINHSLAFT